MKTYLPILTGLGVGAAMLVYRFWASWRQSRTWASVGQKLGLGREPATWSTPPALSGTIRDVRVNVDTEIVRYGKSRKVYTEVRAPLTGMAPAGLTIYREGLAQKAAKMVGGQDIQIGDDELDDALIIKADHGPETVDMLHNASVKRALLIGLRRHKELRIDGRAVVIRASGRTTDADTLESYINTVVQLVESIDKACNGRPDSQPTQPQPAKPLPMPDDRVDQPRPASPTHAAESSAAKPTADSPTEDPQNWW